MHPVLPFRWDLAARTPDLSRVAPIADPWPGYRGQLLALTVRVVQALDGADPVFVGRSCESIFDLLGALLTGTRRDGAARLLLFSAFAQGRIDLDHALRCPSLRANLAQAGLEPARLVARKRPVALVDVVASGATLGRVMQALARWCEEERADWPAVCRKLRVVSVRSNMNGTWRDGEDAAWLASARGVWVRDVFCRRRLWEWLADEQPKVTPSHTPDRWEERASERPNRSPLRLAALRAAIELRAWGRTPEVRDAFSRWLSAREGLRRPEVRALVQDLRARHRSPASHGPPFAGARGAARYAGRAPSHHGRRRR